MELLNGLYGNSHFLIRIFTSESGNCFRNIFMCIQNIPFGLFDWRHFKKDKIGVTRFEGCFSAERVKEIMEQIEEQGSLQIDGQTLIEFGQLEKRNPIFISNETRNSMANGWWPGTLKHGCWVNQWYSINAKYKLSEKTSQFIKNSTGFDLTFLPDFLNSIIHINSLERYTPNIGFNPDNWNVSFLLEGEVEEAEHRVVIQIWETKETQYSEILDLPSGRDHVSFRAPFEPQQLAYQLYIRNGDKWMELASERHALIQKININMGIVTGKLEVNFAGKKEIREIVNYDKSVGIAEDGHEKPWVLAEHERHYLNEGIELRSLGSVFVRNRGQETRKELQLIIQNELYETAHDYIYLWDPYINNSLLDSLLILAITKPSMSIRLLLSEHGQQSLEIRKEKIENVIDRFKRSHDIVSTIHQYKDKPIDNLEVRNWYGKDQKHAFHDRFIITDKGVWHFGSSIADIGDYHSTVYRLKENMAEIIRSEFMAAWNGDYGAVKTYGLEIAPQLKWLDKEGPYHE
jgi:hypothetical protein